jgi:galactitol-specific phosphotransferase system IIB component
MGARAKKTKIGANIYVLKSIGYKGATPQVNFHFNADTLEEAISLAKDWGSHHSFVYERDYIVEKAGNEKIFLHNEYIPKYAKGSTVKGGVVTYTIWRMDDNGQRKVYQKIPTEKEAKEIKAKEQLKYPKEIFRIQKFKGEFSAEPLDWVEDKYAKGSTVKDNRMNERTRAVILKIQKTRIHPNDVSPNFVSEIANENGINLSSEEVVFISDNYSKKFGNGGGVAISSESGLAVGTNADLLMNQQNLQYAHGGGVGKVRMKLQDEGGFDEYLEEINFDFNKNKIEFEDENIIIVSKEIAEEFENDSVAYVLIGNELYKKGSTLPTFEKLPKNRQANKKYKYFAVGKDDGKIVNGWEIVSDLESLKYYAKGDLKDMDLKPSDFKIISKERLMRSGINPFDYDNWRKIDYSNDMPYIPKAKKGTNIKGKKSKGGIKIESYLPIFSGFYNTIFEANEEMYIEEPYSYDDYDFNYEKYHLDVAKACVDAIETQLNDLGISVSVKFQELNSPREYNFRNDRIDVVYTLGANSLNEIHGYLLENKDAFSEYVKDNYTSRSGFHSFHSNQSDEWLDNIKNGTDLDHKLGAVLDFILQNENYTDDKLYYDVMDNVYLEADLKEGVRDNEEYINEYAKDNYLNKTQSEVVSDLISHFEENDIEYNEDKVTEIVNNYYLSVGNQSLDLFSTKKGKKKMEQGGGVNGWCYEVGGL